MGRVLCSKLVNNPSASPAPVTNREKNRHCPNRFLSNGVPVIPDSLDFYGVVTSGLNILSRLLLTFTTDVRLYDSNLFSKPLNWGKKVFDFYHRPLSNCRSIFMKPIKISNQFSLILFHAQCCNRLEPYAKQKTNSYGVTEKLNLPIGGGTQDVWETHRGATDSESWVWWCLIATSVQRPVRGCIVPGLFLCEPAMRKQSKES